MKILVAVDFGLFGKAQTQFLYDYTAPAGSSILVLHVIEPLVAVPCDYPFPFVPTISNEILEARHKSAEELVADVCSRLSEKYPPHMISKQVREGPTSDVILSVAEQWKADLILVGSHGKTGLQRFLLGSVSAQVAQHACCSVMIARMPAEQKKPIS